jgi:hypothetical protein
MVVAMDIQSGALQQTLASGQAEIGQAVVFARPFAAAPIVVLGTQSAGGTAGRIVFGRQSAITTTGFTCWLQGTGAAASAVTQTTSWLAYGPRA